MTFPCFESLRFYDFSVFWILTVLNPHGLFLTGLFSRVYSHGLFLTDLHLWIYIYGFIPHGFTFMDLFLTDLFLTDLFPWVYSSRILFPWVYPHGFISLGLSSRVYPHGFILSGLSSRVYLLGFILSGLLARGAEWSNSSARGIAPCSEHFARPKTVLWHLPRAILWFF